MASDDEIRAYVDWYVNVLTAAAQAINDGEDAGQVIRDRVDGLDEAELRNVVQVMLAHHAQVALEHGKQRR
jgi:hypothetical protein